jgi:mannose-6-phosphate isomerase-like protein (cupin superfamily)
MVNNQTEYKNVIVNKPWGYEYLAYENEHVGLWFLHIEKSQQTSLHCHPKKDTGLIVLDGTVDVSFLNDINRLVAGRKIMIRKGLFHSTKALSEGGANIFEIETPKLKHDLVRLEDKYGRKAKPYEGKSSEEEKTRECIFFKDPKKNEKNTYIFSNCKIFVESITDKDSFMKIEDHENIMFLNGGILTDQKDILVASPGDVIAAHIVKRLLGTFDKVHPNTTIMIIKSLDKKI